MNEEKEIAVVPVLPEPEDERLRRIAGKFLREAGELSKLFARKGRLVGTDGRVMLCIDRECIEPRKGDGGAASVLDWMDRAADIDVEVDAAGLAGSVPKLVELRRRAAEENRLRREELDRDAVYCPCCGSRLDIEHVRGNVFNVEEFDEDAEAELPDSLLYVEVRAPGLPKGAILDAKYLLDELRAGEALGGVRRAGFVMEARAEFWGEAYALRMEGDGWRSVLMPARRCQVDPCEVLKLMEIELAAGGPAAASSRTGTPRRRGGREGKTHEREGWNGDAGRCRGRDANHRGCTLRCGHDRRWSGDALSGCRCRPNRGGNEAGARSRGRQRGEVAGGGGFC